MINKITLTLFLAACVVANSAQAQMKLIGRAVNEHKGGANETRDSILYFYSGTKTPGKYTNMPDYTTGADSIHKYTLNGTTMEMSERTIFYWSSTTLDSVIVIENDNGTWKNDYKIEIANIAGKPDTARYRSWRSQSQSWSTYAYRIYSWSGNNVTSEERIRRVWNNQKKEWELRNDWKKVMTYSSNKTADSIYQDYNNGSYENQAKTTYTYSGNNIATIDEAVPDGSGWKINHRTQNTYDGSGRLELSKSELLNGTSWEGDDSISYFYTGANTVPDSALAYAFQFNLYAPQMKHVFMGNTDGQITTERFESFNGTAFDYDGTDSTINWYYGWNVGIDDVEDTKTLLSIYPTPASNNITIQLDDAFKGKEILFSIIDMQGRRLAQWSEANYQSATNISVADLPAGNYILHAGNGSAVIAERFIISK